MIAIYEAKAVSFVACYVSEAHPVAHVATGDGGQETYRQEEGAFQTWHTAPALTFHEPCDAIKGLSGSRHAVKDCMLYSSKSVRTRVCGGVLLRTAVTCSSLVNCFRSCYRHSQVMTGSTRHRRSVQTARCAQKDGRGGQRSGDNLSGDNLAAKLLGQAEAGVGGDGGSGSCGSLCRVTVLKREKRLTLRGPPWVCWRTSRRAARR